MLKTCTKCKIEKDLSEFHILRNAPDGRNWNCKACKTFHLQQWRLKDTVRLEKRNKRIALSLRTHKICIKCGVDKPLSEFNWKGGLPRSKGSTIDGYRHECRTCQIAYVAVWRQTHHNQTDMDLKRYYQVTLEEYKIVFESQHGLCALCGNPETMPHSGKMRRLAVDHDHTHHDDPAKGCKECIRGLLCNKCNHGFLPRAEEHPRLQSTFTQEYLKQRPFLQIESLRSQLQLLGRNPRH